jgi:hypothetical protein
MENYILNAFKYIILFAINVQNCAGNFWSNFNLNSDENMSVFFVNLGQNGDS